MSQVDSAEELFAAGLESYPGVMQAVSEFRRLVTEAAKQVMLRHMEEFRAVINKDLQESELKDLNETYDARIQVGVVVNYPETWGIMWGLRWDMAESTSEPKVFLGVRFGGYKRRDSFFKKLSNFHRNDKSVMVGCPEKWPYDAQLFKEMAKNGKIGELEEALDEVVSVFLEVCQRKQGLKTLLQEQ